MSSTTESASSKGQVLVLFAGSLVVIFLIAALAFDVGMTLLERRDQQNAADAAALAGARYVRTSANFNGSCAAAGTNAAVIAACDMAIANDFDNAAADENVLVRIPPVSGEFRNLPGHIQVDINATRGSIFAGVIGIGNWAIGATAVAANQPGVHYEFGMIALDPDDCDAIKVTGTGTVNSAGSIQSNSDGSGCGGGSFDSILRGGGGDINVTAPGVCRAVGDIKDESSAGSLNCTKDPFSFALPDPLASLPAPVKPVTLAPAMKEVIAGVVTPVTNANAPNNCPGKTSPPSRVPSETSPATCVLGNGPDAGRQFILYQGLYPGGLSVKGSGTTVFLTPGIYWIGGGGFSAQNGSIISVNSETDRTPATCTVGATPPCVNGGGVLIYNSKLGTSGAGAAGPISLNGNPVMLNLQPYHYPFGSTTIDLVIFQDRTVSDTVSLNGSGSGAGMVRGIVYAPLALVKVNGSNSTFSMDQVIANTFQINGSGGTVNVLREAGVDAIISNVGLVQ